LIEVKWRDAALPIIQTFKFEKRRRIEMPSTDRSQVDIEQTERVPFMQRVLDNPFLLLFLGVTIPTVFYVLWGVMEVASIPIAQ
jgi:hypothetical protein